MTALGWRHLFGRGLNRIGQLVAGVGAHIFQMIAEFKFGHWIKNPSVVWSIRDRVKIYGVACLKNQIPKNRIFSEIILALWFLEKRQKGFEGLRHTPSKRNCCRRENLWLAVTTRRLVP
jgi:hypothetical protein